MAPPADLFTLKDLEKLCAKLEALYARHVCAPRPPTAVPTAAADEEWQDVAIETIRKLAEVVVYGERRSETFFEFFVENRVMGLLVALATCASPCARIQTQVIQTVSILVQNVQHSRSLYLMLSSNYINALVEHAHFERTQDEELQANFVSLLKTLSLRLDAETVQFFVDDDANRFALHDCAVRCIDSSEAMARTAALTTLLNIYRVDDPHVRRFVTRRAPQRRFFERFTGIILAEVDGLFQSAQRQALSGRLSAAGGVSEEDDTTAEDFQATRRVLGMEERGALLHDLFYYAQDLLDMRIHNVEQPFCDYLLKHLVRPLADAIRRATTHSPTHDDKALHAATRQVLESPHQAAHQQESHLSHQASKAPVSSKSPVSLQSSHQASPVSLLADCHGAFDDDDDTERRSLETRAAVAAFVLSLLARTTQHASLLIGAAGATLKHVPKALCSRHEPLALCACIALEAFLANDATRQLVLAQRRDCGTGDTAQHAAPSSNSSSSNNNGRCKSLLDSLTDTSSFDDDDGGGGGGDDGSRPQDDCVSEASAVFACDLLTDAPPRKGASRGARQHPSLFDDCDEPAARRDEACATQPQRPPLNDQHSTTTTRKKRLFEDETGSSSSSSSSSSEGASSFALNNGKGSSSSEQSSELALRRDHAQDCSAEEEAVRPEELRRALCRGLGEALCRHAARRVGTTLCALDLLARLKRETTTTTTTTSPAPGCEEDEGAHQDLARLERFARATAAQQLLERCDRCEDEADALFEALEDVHLKAAHSLVAEHATVATRRSDERARCSSSQLRMAANAFSATLPARLNCERFVEGRFEARTGGRERLALVEVLLALSRHAKSDDAVSRLLGDASLRGEDEDVVDNADTTVPQVTMKLYGRNCLACATLRRTRPNVSPRSSSFSSSEQQQQQQQQQQHSQQQQYSRPGSRPTASPLRGPFAAHAVSLALSAVAHSPFGSSAAPSVSLSSRAAWLDIYLVLDETRLLLAVPDPASLSFGRVLSAAPLRDVAATVDCNNGTKLQLLVRSRKRVGLASAANAHARAHAAQNPARDHHPSPNFKATGHRAAPQTQQGLEATTTHHTPQLWQLSLVFESERNCRVAHHFLNERRAIERKARRDRLYAHIKHIADTPP